MTRRRWCQLCERIHHPFCTSVPRSHRWPTESLVTAAGGVERVHRTIDPGNLHRAIRAGLTDLQADRWAIALGLHPLEVWPDWIDVVLARGERAA